MCTVGSSGIHDADTMRRERTFLSGGSTDSDLSWIRSNVRVSQQWEKQSQARFWPSVGYWCLSTSWPVISKADIAHRGKTNCGTPRQNHPEKKGKKNKLTQPILLWGHYDLYRTSPQSHMRSYMTPSEESSAGLVCHTHAAHVSAPTPLRPWLWQFLPMVPSGYLIISISALQQHQWLSAPTH